MFNYVQLYIQLYFRLIPADLVDLKLRTRFRPENIHMNKKTFYVI